MMVYSFEQKQFDIYFYLLACIPPLIFNSYELFSSNKMTEWVKSHDELLEEIRNLKIV